MVGHVLNTQGLVRVWKVLMFRLQYGDSILKFMLKEIQIDLKCVRQKKP